ncbi:MAG: hypothetical protein LPD71_11300 [Shewanella sp.]|nr:hypothetical protein [Shewanella sp.]MCF1431594.1 hypothetical protein [Shewanella sp.]MCF1439296.1 hypothetical protein [Shewanella sp.]MCF1458326.1 hypothetical protein [Shewanella sp.]
MSKRSWSICLWSGIMLMSGCQSTTAEPVAALSKHTGAAAKQEIQQAIVKLKGGLAPVLADNVFEQNDVLLLEKKPLKDGQGLPIMGRDFQFPSQFNLQLRGEVCGLFYGKTGGFEPLALLECIPKATKQ